MKKLKLKLLIFVLSFLIMHCNLIYANPLKENGIEIINNEIVIHGHVIKPSYDLKISNPKIETDTLISSKASPGNNNILITTGFSLKDRMEWELWLYNISNNKPVKLDIDIPPVRKVWSNWHNEDVLEITYGGFGWKNSYIINTNDLSKTFKVKDILWYDPVHDTYVALQDSGGIEIGSGFNKRIKKKEKFDFNYYAYRNDAFAMIKDIKIDGEFLFVKYENQAGNIETKAFKPDMLKKND